MGSTLFRFIWNVVYPIVLLVGGITISICNAFPLVRVIPGGAFQAGGFPNDPPYDGAACAHGTTMWNCLFAEPSSIASFYILGGLLLIVSGGFFFITTWKRLLAGVCILIAIIGLLLMSLTTFTLLNDGGELLQAKPANTIATLTYFVVLGCSLIRLIPLPPDSPEYKGAML